VSASDGQVAPQADSKTLTRGRTPESVPECGPPRVDITLAPVRSARDALRTCLSAGAGRATHVLVIRSDEDDADYERTDRRILDYRIRLTGATVEFL
jgi:hypothetical protein